MRLNLVMYTLLLAATSCQKNDLAALVLPSPDTARLSIPDNLRVGGPAFKLEPQFYRKQKVHVPLLDEMRDGEQRMDDIDTWSVEVMPPTLAVVDRKGTLRCLREGRGRLKLTARLSVFEWSLSCGPEIPAELLTFWDLCVHPAGWKSMNRPRAGAAGRRDRVEGQEGQIGRTG